MTGYFNFRTGQHGGEGGSGMRDAGAGVEFHFATSTHYRGMTQQDVTNMLFRVAKEYVEVSSRF